MSSRLVKKIEITEACPDLISHSLLFSPQSSLCLVLSTLLFTDSIPRRRRRSPSATNYHRPPPSRFVHRSDLFSLPSAIASPPVASPPSAVASRQSTVAKVIL